MARLGCTCGNTLSNSMCPSENIIYVMAKNRVESALAYNANITLMDFITNWDVLTDSKKGFISEEYIFWYCTECKRVIQCEIHIGGKALSVYKLVENDSTVDFNELFKMNELIVFSNIEEDTATESNSSVTLSSFLESLPKMRYFMSDDNKFVFAYDCKAEQISFVYQSEPLMTEENNKNDA